MEQGASQEASLLREIAGLAALINNHKSHNTYNTSKSFYPAQNTQYNHAPPPPKQRFANRTLTKASTVPPNPITPIVVTNTAPPPKPPFPAQMKSIPLKPTQLPKPKFSNKKLLLNGTTTISPVSKSINPVQQSNPNNVNINSSKVKNSYIRRGNKLVRSSTTFQAKGGLTSNITKGRLNVYSNIPYSPSMYIKHRMAMRRVSQLKQSSALRKRLSFTRKSPLKLAGNTYVRRGGNKLVRNSFKYERPIPNKTPSKADNKGHTIVEQITPNGKRLTIGGQVYVKTPRGRSLVRSKNLSARAAASNRVKRTLQKARKKTQYCLFYNKFGKCNNVDCKYIHDPHKVAVCTKFLKGKCEASNCLLQHKIDADLMPACWHFLRGMCTKDNCPYSHVYVNPQADVCPDFGKGYCPNGKACKLKHIIVNKKAKSKEEAGTVDATEHDAKRRKTEMVETSAANELVDIIRPRLHKSVIEKGNTDNSNTYHNTNHDSNNSSPHIHYLDSPSDSSNDVGACNFC